MTRQSWLCPMKDISVVRQCALLGVSRANVYAHKRAHSTDDNDLLYRRLIDEETRGIRFTARDAWWFF